MDAETNPTKAVAIKEVCVTSEQLDIIQKPVLPSDVLFIRCGPGTGKTHTLVLKLAYLINEYGVSPQDILVLSMTNKAVDNIKDRLKEFVTKEQLQSLRVYTFHAYCHDLVSLVYGDGFEVLQDEGLNILALLFNHRKIKNKYDVNSFIHLYKKGKSVEDIASEFSAKETDVETWIKIFDKMEVSTFKEMLQMGSDVIKGYVDSGDINYKVVVVDEMQDIYHDLFGIIRSVSGNDTHLVASGDLNQSVYEFLNDEDQERFDLLGLPKTYSHSGMSRSFRSTQEILDASEFILDKEVNLHSDKTGPKPFFNVFESETDLTQFTIEQIKELHYAGVSMNDIAVLCRTNNDLRKFSNHLDKEGIDYIKLSSLPMWLQNENFIYFIHYLKVLLKPETSNFELLGTLHLLPKLGAKRLRKIYDESMAIDKNLHEYLLESKKPTLKYYTETINLVRDKINFNDPQDVFSKLLYLSLKLGLANKLQSDEPHERKRVQDQMVELYKSLKHSYDTPDIRSIRSQEIAPRTPIESFLRNFMNFDPQRRAHNKLIISTMHQSKGLEFPIVFVNNGDIQSQELQERNLLYVSMTRPKSLLFLNIVDSMGAVRASLSSGDTSYHRYFQAGRPKMSLLKTLFQTVPKIIKK